MKFTICLVCLRSFGQLHSKLYVSPISRRYFVFNIFSIIDINEHPSTTRKVRWFMSSNITVKQSGFTAKQKLFVKILQFSNQWCTSLQKHVIPNICFHKSTFECWRIPRLRNNRVNLHVSFQDIRWFKSLIFQLKKLSIFIYFKFFAKIGDTSHIWRNLSCLFRKSSKSLRLVVTKTPFFKRKRQWENFAWFCKIISK